MNSWFDFFSSFFEKYENEVETVLYTNGCREGWIQGQMYIYSKDDNFSVNTYKLPHKQGTADLEGKKPFANAIDDPMVAEIKVIASSFLTKNINGRSNIDEFSTGNEIEITQEHLENVNLKNGSVLKDVIRLQSITENVKKIMILVIPVYKKEDEVEDEDEDQNTKLGISLRKISLSKKVLEKQFKGFEIRIWELN